MNGDPGRTVRRIQRRLQTIDVGQSSGQVAWSDWLELEGRVRRLHGLDDRFRHIGLSRYVTPATGIPVPYRVGGECVATEV